MDRGTGADMTPGGLFQDGNPATDSPASEVNALWYNGLTEEMRNVIVAAGLAPDANNWTQLLQALQQLFTPRTGLLQTVRTRHATNTVPSSNIPEDSSIPQATEGEAYAGLTTTITPRFADTLLKVTLSLPVFYQDTSRFQVALFRGADSSAFAASVEGRGVQGRGRITLVGYVVSGTTAPLDIKVRVGSINSARIDGLDFGTAGGATLTVEEIG